MIAVFSACVNLLPRFSNLTASNWWWGGPESHLQLTTCDSLVIGAPACYRAGHRITRIEAWTGLSQAGSSVARNTNMRKVLQYPAVKNALISAFISINTLWITATLIGAMFLYMWQKAVCVRLFGAVLSLPPSLQAMDMCLCVCCFKCCGHARSCLLSWWDAEPEPLLLMFEIVILLTVHSLSAKKTHGTKYVIISLPQPTVRAVEVHR